MCPKNVETVKGLTNTSKDGSTGWTVGRSVGRSGEPFGRTVVGLSVDRLSVNLTVSRSVDPCVRRSVCQSVGYQSVGRSVSRLVGRWIGRATNLVTPLGRRGRTWNAAGGLAHAPRNFRKCRHQPLEVIRPTPPSNSETPPTKRNGEATKHVTPYVGLQHAAAYIRQLDQIQIANLIIWIWY